MFDERGWSVRASLVRAFVVKSPKGIYSTMRERCIILRYFRPGIATHFPGGLQGKGR